MKQTSELIATLKKTLRAHGMTYRDVAEGLGISVASVKRVFAEQTFTLSRLEEVCGLLDITIHDLSRMAQSAGESSRYLSVAQEKALAGDPKLFMYFYLLLGSWKAEQIGARFGVESTLATRLLAHLDRLKLVELLPGDNVRLLTPRNILWRRNGPGRRAYEEQAKAEFLNSSFAGPGKRLLFGTGELSETSAALLMRKMEQLKSDFEELVEVDVTIAEEKRVNAGLLLAFRPWVFHWLTEQLLSKPGTNVE